MEHQDHVNLIRDGIAVPGGTWAEFGSGGGAFTLALADLLGPEAHLFSIDQDRDALARQQAAMHARFPMVRVDYQVADFTQRLAFPPLDGILLANSFHYVRHKAALLALLRSYLRTQGRLLLVEYNAERGNPWVPYPLTYPAWEKLSQEHGFASTRLLATRPSRFLREIYAALSLLA